MTRTSTYHSETDKSVTQAKHYSKTHHSSHRYLAYRDISEIFKKFLNGPRALDYGTGTGYSAKFLFDLGLDVIGVDISKKMLSQAKLNYPFIPFYQIKNGRIPVNDNSYDLIFSSFVLFELSCQEEMTRYLIEAGRVMRKDGLFVAITGSQFLHLPSKKWLNFYTDFQENIALKSGDLAKLYLYDADLEFTDYYWTEKDYLKFFKLAGLDIIKIVYPLGLENECLAWRDELTSSPFVIIIAKHLQNN